MPNPSKTYLYKNVISFLSTLNPEKTLDLGCGDLFIFNSINTENYTGVDYNEEKIQKAKINYPNANLIRSKIEEFESEQKYDLVICLEMDSLNKINNPEDILKILKKLISHSDLRGYIILNFWSDFFFMNKKKIKEIFIEEKISISKEISYGIFNFYCPHWLWKIIHFTMPLINSFSFLLKKKCKLFILKK